MSTTENKPFVYVNTAPMVNNKTDGTKFWTVLIGLCKALREESDKDCDKFLMSISESQVVEISNAFSAARQNGARLIMLSDDFNIGESKMSKPYINKDGELVSNLQASVWVEGSFELSVQSPREMSISPELQALMGDNHGNDEAPF